MKNKQLDFNIPIPELQNYTSIQTNNTERLQQLLQKELDLRNQLKKYNANSTNFQDIKLKLFHVEGNIANYRNTVAYEEREMVKNKYFTEGETQKYNRFVVPTFLEEIKYKMWMDFNDVICGSNPIIYHGVKPGKSNDLVFSLIDSADKDITNSINTIHKLREQYFHDGIQTMKDADCAYKMFTVDVKKICNDLNIRHKDLITRTQTKVNQYKNEIQTVLSQLDKDDKGVFVKVINKVTKYVENTVKKLPTVKELYGEDFAKIDDLLKNIDEIKSYKNRVEKLMERNEKTNKNSKIVFDDNVDYGNISDVFIKLKSLRDDFSKVEPALDQLFQNLNLKISALNLQEPPLEDNVLQQYIENINDGNEGNLWEDIELQDDDPMLKKYIVALEELETQKKSIENATKKIKTLENEKKAQEVENKKLEAKNKTLENEKKAQEVENKTLENENKTLENENKTLENENKTLENEKKAQEVENKKLEAKNKTQEEKLTELKEHLTALFDCHHNPSEENNQHFKEVEVQIKKLLGVGLVNNDFLNDFLN